MLKGHRHLLQDAAASSRTACRYFGRLYHQGSKIVKDVCPHHGEYWLVSACFGHMLPVLYPMVSLTQNESQGPTTSQLILTLALKEARPSCSRLH